MKIWRSLRTPNLLVRNKVIFPKSKKYRSKISSILKREKFCPVCLLRRHYIYKEDCVEYIQRKKLSFFVDWRNYSSKSVSNRKNTMSHCLQDPFLPSAFLFLVILYFKTKAKSSAKKWINEETDRGTQFERI